MAEKYVTLLRIKRKKDDALREAFGEALRSVCLCTPAFEVCLLYVISPFQAHACLSATHATHSGAVVEGLSEGPRKRAATSTALTSLRIADDRPDSQNFTHIASLPLDKLDWMASHQKLACLLQDSMQRCAACSSISLLPL